MCPAGNIEPRDKFRALSIPTVVEGHLGRLTLFNLGVCAVFTCTCDPFVGTLDLYLLLFANVSIFSECSQLQAQCHDAHNTILDEHRTWTPLGSIRDR